MKKPILFSKYILMVCIGTIMQTTTAEGNNQLLHEFGTALIQSTIHNGTTLERIANTTNCEILPDAPFVNDPDGNAVFAAQKAYCKLRENNIPVSKDNKELAKYLVAGQLQRIKYIIDLHSDRMYTATTPTPTRSQWRSIISSQRSPASFGAVEVEIQKVLLARDELKKLKVSSETILFFIGQ